MFSKKLLTTAAIITSMTAHAALAEGNSVSGNGYNDPVVQFGDNNLIDVTQVGVNNMARLSQIGNNNTTTIEQVGSDNYASLNQFPTYQYNGSTTTESAKLSASQTGNRNAVRTELQGDNISSSVAQNGDDNIASQSGPNGVGTHYTANYTANIVQTGNGNETWVKNNTYSTGSSVDVRQIGDLNNADIKLGNEYSYGQNYLANNSAIIHQASYNNAEIEIVGNNGVAEGNSATIQQDGLGGNAKIGQYGSFNTASITQSGILNTASLAQAGNGNTAHITQR